MKSLPHVYSVAAAGSAGGSIAITAAGLPPVACAPPPEFGGPGDQWSPEALLAAAVASCFILTFRAIARSSRLEWTRLECHAEGTLDRVDGVLQFTRFTTRATLTVPEGTSSVLCERALTKAEEGCLVANSLRCQRELQMELIKAQVNESENALV
ncbi:MAG: OsmC family protein [Pseudomonadota bacterium]|nr:OsmC family protein [Pseudomonadota bacterium]